MRKGVTDEVDEGPELRPVGGDFSPTDTTVLDEKTAALSIDSPSSAGPPSFHRLPDAVVVKIFDQLTLKEKVRVELVSKRWRRLAIASWASLTRFILPDYSGLYGFRAKFDDLTFIK